MQVREILKNNLVSCSRAAVAALFLGPAACASMTAQPPENAYAIDLDYGPYDAGFQILEAVDPSREICAETDAECEIEGRPLRIFVWYPSEADGAELVFSDLVELDDPESTYAEFNDFQNNRIKRAFSGQFFFLDDDPKAEKSALLQAQVLRARHDATPAGGAFPLIVHAVGLGSHQIEGVYLWEYLASHGYVVAVPGQLGLDTANASARMDGPNASLIANDVAFTRDTVAAAGFGADASRAGYVGHSFGSVPILVSASHESERAAPLVFLDGSVNNELGVAAFDETGADAGAVRSPVLNLMSTGRDDLDPRLMDAVTNASVSSWRIPDASHFDFQNWGVYMGQFGDDGSPALRRRTEERGSDVALAAIRQTRDFFEWTLKNDAAAAARIASGEGIAGDGGEYAPATE